MNTPRTPPVSLHLKENLRGRIENLAMAPSYENTLIPVFEAIMNSIHSVQDRFGEDWANNGVIHVRVDRDEEGHPNSFTIEDNGSGLNDPNFDSFLTYDSRYKLKKGGKGVGRLTWLKVFRRARIGSIYSQSDRLKERRFDFVLDNDQAIKNYTEQDLSSEPNLRTTIFLDELKDGYKTSCPQKIETITHRIVGHFLPFLIGEVCPDILVSDNSEEYSLRQIIADHTRSPKTQDFKVEDVGEFTIKHLLLSHTLVEKNTEHTIYLSAHDRIVIDHGINNQTGLDSAFEHGDDRVVYVGIVASEFLDANVTQERNNFDIRKQTLTLITKEAEECAKVYLEEPIQRVIDLKAETIGRVIDGFPRYRYLVKDRKDFAKKLPLNRKTEEDIYREMSVYDYRASRSVKGELSKIISSESEPASSTEFQERLDTLMERIGEQEIASLAEYVGKRKLIIDLLSSRLGYKHKEKKQRHTEEAIHKIICPLRVNSGDIEYGQHNLWLIDDRLAYYDFWASDQNIRKFAKSSECTERPDLILFQGSNLLQRKGTNQPVVIVEFKRPARTEYADDENPILQVYDYVRELRDNKISDNDGNLITEIGSDTPFFCYLVCDITPRLLGIMEDYKINQKLPGGRGYFGYNDSRRAYIEVLQYSEIVDDARLRHEAFFKELGIN